MERSAQITRILREIGEGNSSGVDELMPLVYDRCHAIAAKHLRDQSPAHTLQPTALVNELYLKLVDVKQVEFKGRTHFFAVAAKAMRQILVDHARGKLREKRGGGRQRVELREDTALSPQRDEDLLALEEALARLEKLNARHGRIVELRFFGGLSVEETAEVLGVSKRTVEGEWTLLRAWLRRELGRED
ncbi:MAG: sigma-70 family RNA polymerase sigma factor [Planctomycetota bacterium]